MYQSGAFKSFLPISDTKMDRKDKLFVINEVCAIMFANIAPECLVYVCWVHLSHRACARNVNSLCR